jgi:hypothetical protein
MESMAFAKLAKLLSFQAIRVIFLIFDSSVVTVLAIRTRQYNANTHSRTPPGQR